MKRVTNRKVGSALVRDPIAGWGGGVRVCSALAVWLGLLAPAGAQSVGEGWFGLESFSGTGADRGVDIAYWDDPNSNDDWIYVCGYVTEGSATRLAVWRYNAEADGGAQGWVDRAIFPRPEDVSTVSGATQATAITVHPVSGDVYVTGFTPIETTNWPTFGSDYNYLTLKFTKDLEPSGTWQPGTGNINGWRIYDGPDGGLADKAVDIVVDGDTEGDGPYVYVTGWSDDSTTDKDIMTLKYDQQGDLSPTRSRTVRTR